MLADTVPKMLLAKFKEYGEKRVAMRRKRYGLWIEYTWKEYYEYTKYFSLGLVKLGLKPGDKVAILGENDPEWYWSALAAQSARATCVGIFDDSVPSEVEYILNHSDSSFIVAKDQEQTDKILEIRDKIPQVRKVIYWDPKGMVAYKSDLFFVDFYEVVKLGKEYEEEYPGLFERNVEDGIPEDAGLICYISRTTGGKPKGAVLSQDYLVNGCKILCSVDNWSPRDNYLSFISPAWGVEWELGITSGLRSGAIICFPEKPATVQADTREIGPSVLFYSPMTWERLNSMIHARIAGTYAPFRFIFNTSLKIGYKVVNKRFQKKSVGLIWRTLYLLADLLLFRHLRDRIGLSRINRAYTGGAGISPEIVTFFRAIGVNIKQMYRLTEAHITSLHRDGDIKPETCGLPLPGYKLKISDEGELLVKTPIACFSGYIKDPESSMKIFDNDGWIKTGDAANILPDGHVVVLGRVEDVVDLGGGHKLSLNFVESHLRSSPYIRGAMVVTEPGKNSISAVITIDYENVRKWAERNHLKYSTFTDLSQNTEVSNIVLKEVERVNSVLPDWSRIQKYVLLHKEFNPDEGGYTKTGKLRRALMLDQYRDIVNGLYSQAKELWVETPVTYKDGRKDAAKIVLKIRSVGGE
jgi:long-chain acyl-CoA synthetase